MPMWLLPPAKLDPSQSYEWYLLGRNGNRWAWEKRRWDGVESFRKTQRKWATWTIVVDVITFLAIAGSAGSGSSG